MRELDDLIGLARINLERSPWAKSRTPQDWLRWLKGEILEFEASLECPEHRGHVEEELGDVLHNVVHLALALGGPDLLARIAEGSAQKLAFRKPWLVDEKLLRPQTADEEMTLWHAKKRGER